MRGGATSSLRSSKKNTVQCLTFRPTRAVAIATVENALKWQSVENVLSKSSENMSTCLNIAHQLAERASTSTTA